MVSPSDNIQLTLKSFARVLVVFKEIDDSEYMISSSHDIFTAVYQLNYHTIIYCADQMYI